MVPGTVRWWAVASGVTGLVADLFLVLFYVTAKPWTDTPAESWFGFANDVVMIAQYVALLPVVLGLGRLLAQHRRARVWTPIGLIAAVAVVVLQTLLVTGLMPFDVQVGFVSAASIVSMLWAGVISGVGARGDLLPPAVTRLGRILLIGVPVAFAAFAAGAVVTAAADVAWAWVAGGVPGFVIWLLFPVWTLLVGTARR